MWEEGRGMEEEEEGEDDGEEEEGGGFGWKGKSGVS